MRGHPICAIRPNCSLAPKTQIPAYGKRASILLLLKCQEQTLVNHYVTLGDSLTCFIVMETNKNTCLIAESNSIIILYCTLPEDERKPDNSKGDSSKTAKSTEMAESKVDNDGQAHTDKVASTENQQHTNKELADKDSKIREGKNEETSKMKSNDKIQTTTNDTPSRQIDNSATGESRSNTTDINPGIVNPTEKASSVEVKPNPDVSKSTEDAKSDSSKPTEKDDTVKPSDKTDNSKSTVKTDISKPTDKTVSSKPTDKVESKVTDNADSKPTDKSDSSKASEKTNDKNEADTKLKTGTIQEDKENNANNKILSSNDTTAVKALNSNSSQDTKLPDNGLTPKDIQATLAQEEEYDGLNMNSSDATGRPTMTDDRCARIYTISKTYGRVGNMLLCCIVFMYTSSWHVTSHW